MDFKNGNWNLNEALDFDLEKASDLLDDKASNRIVGNLRKHMGPEGFPRPGPLPQGGGFENDANQYKPKRDLVTRSGSKDKRKHWDLPAKSAMPPSGFRHVSNLGKQASKPDLKGASPSLQKFQNGGLPTPKGPGGLPKARTASKDGDLLTSMTKRLAQLEKLNSALRLEVKEKGLEINTLKQENDRLMLAADKDSLRELNRAIDERDKYKKQCAEMEKFLADYGLKWLGEDQANESLGAQHEGEFQVDAINQELAHAAPAYRNNLPKEIDTEVLTRRIEELNFIAEKQRVVTNQYGMKEFQALAPVQIFFFKNGIMIKGRQFQPYYSKQAQSVLSDILDGYFPYDLKKDYPDGVPLEPVDFTDDTFTPDMLKNNKDPKLRILQELDGKSCAGMSKQEFLAQFPKNVINKGNVVPIREELEKRFKETGQIDVSKLNSNEPIEAFTHVAQNESDYQPSEIVTLRIRTETGKRTVIVKLLRTDKMAALYEAVEPYIELNDRAFELRSKFPNRAYEKGETQNLEQLGLAPSSALVVHSKN